VKNYLDILNRYDNISLVRWFFERKAEKLRGSGQDCRADERVSEGKGEALSS